MRAQISKQFVALILAVVLALSMAIPTHTIARAVDTDCTGHTGIVSNNSDSTFTIGLLRWEIYCSHSGDTITFASALAGQTITLTTYIKITKNLTIDGSELSTPISISGDNSTQIFYVNSTILAVIDTLILKDGFVDYESGPAQGGAIANYGTLTLRHMTFTNNHTSAFQSQGGAIYNGGTLSVDSSTFTNNSATSAFSYGGAIYNASGGSMSVLNSTFSGNSAHSDSEAKGGAIYNAGNMSVFYSTFSGNSALVGLSGTGSGGGIYNIGNGGMLINTIVAGSSAAGGNCSGNPFNSISKDNLADDVSCTGDFSFSASILLGTLGNYGGPTQTIPLLAGSSAIDYVDIEPYCVPGGWLDQRGLTRPMGASCDAGAFEYEIILTITSLSPDSAAEGDDAFTLHVYGTGFFPHRSIPSKAGISGTYGFEFYNGSIVCWNGEPRTTTFVDETELEADIPAEDIISAHSVAFVTVFNPIGVFADINTGPTVGNFTSCGYDFIGKAAIPAADIISNSNMVSPLPMMSNALPFFITFTGAAVTGFDMDTGDDPSATFEGITANATGNGTLVVAQYAENPAGTVFGHGNQYFDVHAGTGNTFTQVTFQVCGVRARETLILFWDGSKWAPASNQTRGPGNCVTVVVDATTLPNLEQLAGALIRTQVVGGGGYLIYFFDVPPSHWAYSWVMDLAKAGITTGCGYRLFCPEEPVTRAQMAIFLERGMNGWDYTPPAATGMVFADVPLSYWSVDWIEKLFADGITGGCGTNPLNYCPDGPVSHAQMAVLLLRAKHGAAYTPPNATGIFTDVPTSFWAANWIEQLAAEGITTGCGGGNYCPEAPVTRAEMAKFLVITFNLP